MAPPPRTKEEFQRRFVANVNVDGFTFHLPCCFCGAADFMVYNVARTREALEAGSICHECGRGARGVFVAREEAGDGFEMMQTTGDDPPWFIPIKRVQ